jgi:hypothetical protein
MRVSQPAEVTAGVSEGARAYHMAGRSTVCCDYCECTTDGCRLLVGVFCGRL